MILSSLFFPRLASFLNKHNRRSLPDYFQLLIYRHRSYIHALSLSLSVSLPESSPVVFIRILLILNAISWENSLEVLLLPLWPLLCKLHLSQLPLPRRFCLSFSSFYFLSTSRERERERERDDYKGKQDLYNICYGCTGTRQQIWCKQQRQIQCWHYSWHKELIWLNERHLGKACQPVHWHDTDRGIDVTCTWSN